MAFGAGVLLLLTAGWPAHAGEMEERSAIERRTVIALVTHDFAKLEAMDKAFQSSSERTSSGLWKLTMFAGGIDDAYNIPCSNVGGWQRAEDMAAGWVAAYPKSAGARIGYAQMLFDRAWAYRGGGYANSVPQENWKPFRDYLLKARAYLQGEAAFAKGDPRYVELMLLIANGLQEPEAEYAALAREALERHPDYYQLYFAVMDHYLPKWGGDTATVEAFARAAVDHTKSTDGYGMYARIYWAASQNQFGDALFARSEASWADMKRGITDVLARYDEPWNLNNFARFACLAGDRPFARDLFKQIGGDAVPQAWTGPVKFIDCKNWAEAG